MSDTHLPDKKETSARYEFRAFAHDFGLAEEAIRRDAGEARYRESLEVYLMSAGNDENNTKVWGRSHGHQGAGQPGSRPGTVEAANEGGISLEQGDHPG